jgi:activating signal cointegrator 1
VIETAVLAPRVGDRVLSVRQPWASLLLAPGDMKIIENRSWATPHRGRLWLHASATRPHERDWDEILAGEPDGDTDDGGLELADGTTLPPLLDLPRGALLGCVDLVDCLERHALPPDLAGRWDAEGPWCWVARSPLLLPRPIPAKGRLQVWRW